MTTIPLKSAAEADLFDIDLPDNMVLSVFPPVREHLWDAFWWDQGGRDPLDQKFIFKLEPGPERTEELKRIVEKYPRYGPKMYEKCGDAGRADIMRELLSLGASLDVGWAKRKPEEGEDEELAVPQADMESPLTNAAWAGHLECIKVLIEEANLPLDFEDERGATALINAIHNRHLDIVEYLLDEGAKINPERDGRISDLAAGVKSGSMEVLKRLLAHPQLAESHIETQHLPLAAHSGNPDMVKFVLETADFPPYSLERSFPDPEFPKSTPAQISAVFDCIPHAIRNRMLDTLKLLLSHLTRHHGDGTFAYRALSDNHAIGVLNFLEDAMKGATDIPELFALTWETLLCPPQAELDASQEARDRRHEWLHRRFISACAEGCPETVKLMCEKYGANVNHLSINYFSTPLGRAAASNANPLPPRLAVAKYLLERPDIDIHLASGEVANGPTALALAVKMGFDQPSMVRLLLDYGGPVEEVDATLVEQAKALAPDTTMPVCVVLFRNDARWPVRLMTKEGHKLAAVNHELTMVQLDVKAGAVEKLITNLQVRKRDPVLAASDPEQRPLQELEHRDITDVYAI